MDNKKILLISALLIVIINIAFYGKTKDYDFVNYDDPGYVVENPLIKNDAGNIKKIFTRYYFANYQPLVLLSYSLDYRFSKLYPKSYHITNIVFHVLNSVLVLLLLYLITGRPWISVAVALLFSIHPVQAESVAWISERKGLMSAFFYLLSFLAYIRFARKGKSAFYIISIVLFLFSLLSKPMSVTLPVILILFDYYEDELNRSKLIGKVPFFLLAAVFSVITLFAQKSGGGITRSIPSSFLVNFINPFYNIAHYIAKLSVPINLSAHYEYPVSFSYLSYKFAVSVIVIICIVTYLLKFRKIKREINFSILFFLVSLIPILRFLPVGRAFAADRYMYLPMIGFFLAIAFVTDSVVSSKPQLKKMAGVVSVSVILLFAALGYSRLEVWRNGHELWKNVLESYPCSKYARVYYNDTVLMRGRSFLNLKQFESAREQYFIILDDEASKAVPQSIKESSHVRRAWDYYYTGELKEIRRDALYDVGMSYLYENDLDKAEKYFTHLVSEFKKNAKGYMQLGNISDMKRDGVKAEKFYKKSLELDDTDSATHYNYAVFLENSGNIEGALEYYRLAVKYKSNWELPKKAVSRLTGQK